MLTDAHLDLYGKYETLVGPTCVPYRCRHCRRYANGRLDGKPVCSDHFDTVESKKMIVKKLLVKFADGILSEEECPVCMEDFIPVATAVCGHRVCSDCCRGMQETGRTIMCPMCRDTRFRDLVHILTR